MLIKLNIQNCTDKKALVYGLAESGYPVCFEPIEQSRLIPINRILFVQVPNEQEGKA